MEQEALTRSFCNSRHRQSFCRTDGAVTDARWLGEQMHFVRRDDARTHFDWSDSARKYSWTRGLTVGSRWGHSCRVAWGVTAPLRENDIFDVMGSR